MHHEFAGVAQFETNNGSEASNYFISNQISDYLHEEKILRLGIKNEKKMSSDVKSITDLSKIPSSNFFKVKANFDKAKTLEESDFNFTRYSGRCLYRRVMRGFEMPAIPSLLILQKSTFEKTDPVFGNDYQLDMQVFGLYNEKGDYFDNYTNQKVEDTIKDQIQFHKMRFRKVFLGDDFAVTHVNNNPTKKVDLRIRKLDGTYYLEKPIDGYICYYFKKIN